MGLEYDHSQSPLFVRQNWLHLFFTLNLGVLQKASAQLENDFVSHFVNRQK
jgi:hypothetical protein